MNRSKPSSSASIPTNFIRISCAALCRIEIDGKFLLEINKNRGNVLTPIGGALEFCDEARPFLDSLGAEFQKGNDLRLTLPLDQLPAFERWFRERKDRETDPMRELSEELIDEHQLDISEETIRKLESDYLWSVSMQTASTRKDQQGVETRYFFEVFDVRIAEESSGLVTALTGSNRLRLLCRDEIDRKSSVDGIPVGDNVPILFRCSTGR